jgi:hypothetical protein
MRDEALSIAASGGCGVTTRSIDGLPAREAPLRPPPARQAAASPETSSPWLPLTSSPEQMKKIERWLLNKMKFNQEKKGVKQASLTQPVSPQNK